MLLLITTTYLSQFWRSTAFLLLSLALTTALGWLRRTKHTSSEAGSWRWLLGGNLKVQLLLLFTPRRLGSKKELYKRPELHSTNHHKPWAQESLKAVSAYFICQSITQGQHTAEGSPPPSEKGTACLCRRKQVVAAMLETVYHRKPEKHNFPHKPSEKV